MEDGSPAARPPITYNDSLKLDLTIIDLEDCFFTIPLHPEDAPKFASSVPSLNMQEPLQRFHWVLLPQGMKNSPTVCQWFVSWALSPVGQAKPHVLLYYYMDDILIAAEKTRSPEGNLSPHHRSCKMCTIANSSGQDSTTAFMAVFRLVY